MTQLLSKLTKSEILALPGFNDEVHQKKTIRELMDELNQFKKKHGMTQRGLKVNDYVEVYRRTKASEVPKAPEAPKTMKPLTRYVDTDEYKARQRQKADKELLSKLKASKERETESRKKKEQYEESIRNRARQEWNKKKDDELFNNIIPKWKEQRRQEKIERKWYKDSIKHESKLERVKNEQIKERLIYDELEFLEIPKDELDELNKEYRNRIENVKDHETFKKRLSEWIDYAKKRISFEVSVVDDEETKLAFCEVLRYVYNHRESNKDVIYVKAINLDGKPKYFTLNNPDAKSSKSKGVDIMIGHISGSIDLQTDCSDNHPFIVDMFVPIKYELIFLNIDEYRRGKQKSHRFSYTKASENHKDDPDIIELEMDDELRELIEGSFFRYVNLSGVDLSRYQIFNEIVPSNYKDNCFVYACLQSGVFTNEEMDTMRRSVMTRSVPNDKIKDIARQFKCHFIVKRIDETRDVKHQMRVNIDTRSLKSIDSSSWKRTVELLLFKEHYMINDDDIGYATYYIDHQTEIDEDFKHIPIKKRRLIQRIRDGRPDYAKKGVSLIYALRHMFDNDYFKEINACEQNILATCEYNNHLADYVELDYDEETCCRAISKDQRKTKFFKHIYYSDFETDVTVTPHKEYLNCTTWIEDGKAKCKTFIGDDIGKTFLDFLESNSLIYFHNLKYDSCFFKNVPEWETPKIIERNGQVLQLILTKTGIVDGKKTVIKRLTFADSLALIPAPLRDFSNMFNLNVHKEIMAYKLYTKDNRDRNILPSKEFMDAYDAENRDRKFSFQLEDDHKQLIDNAKKAGAYDSENDTIDIMKYATYYCKMDCIVLMKGMMKFNRDLSNVFKETNCPILSVYDYISISAIGFQFCRQYGCFDECFELSGKPQEFIGRCVSGGRTMTADNRKQYIEGKLQDFDAVSLYPSAMKFMDGVPKGKPKIIPSNATTEDLLKYDTFFAEINITSIKCKCERPYSFGLTFKHGENGSKLYGNETVEHFYIDKRYFLDLMEYYEFEYEFIRGYYFDEGFNTKINEFIEILFNLRLKYKQAKNPLQNTIKLLLNSIYGKSILKPIETETKCIPKKNMWKYMYRNYNYIKEVNVCDEIDNVYVKRVKPIVKHFNLPQFGVSVLSWSKYLMNRVMMTAEQNGIELYYQDTDSMHLNEDDVPVLAKLFKDKYGSELIGTKLGQFHCDFDAFDGAVGDIHSRKLIALGKKSYMDILVDDEGNEGVHIRLKGIPKQVILNKCTKLGVKPVELYERMYNGESFTFDLLDGANCFRKDRFFQMTNVSKFNRTLKF